REEMGKTPAAAWLALTAELEPMQVQRGDSWRSRQKVRQSCITIGMDLIDLSQDRGRFPARFSDGDTANFNALPGNAAGRFDRHAQSLVVLAQQRLDAGPN